ncbi:RluA family pseudouridine synthase [Clostridiales bacterium COT073_COT-073]|nr:RluA family pseudouridine synthase [Clostridiales bacterium COT073_COT-073]
MEKIIYQSRQPIRLDKFLTEYFPEVTRSTWQKMIKEGKCLVNQKRIKANYNCQPGDVIEVEGPTAFKEETAVLPENIALDIIYEDADILVINKPRGMVVHPAPGHNQGTLVNAIMHHCGQNLSAISGAFRPGIVHRIDKDTTGLLLVAKNDEIHEQIAKELKEHNIFRRYEAIVQNNIKEDEGTITTFLDRANSDRKKMAVTSSGRLAITHFTVLERLKQGQFTYVSCCLETGRTHQIRVHMAHRGNPVLGDKVYGPKKSNFRLDGQLLHARELAFIHPRTGKEMRFTSELPIDFKNILTVLRNYDNLF